MSLKEEELSDLVLTQIENACKIFEEKSLNDDLNNNFKFNEYKHSFRWKFDNDDKLLLKYKIIIKLPASIIDEEDKNAFNNKLEKYLAGIIVSKRTYAYPPLVNCPGWENSNNCIYQRGSYRIIGHQDVEHFQVGDRAVYGDLLYKLYDLYKNYNLCKNKNLAILCNTQDDNNNNTHARTNIKNRRTVKPKAKRQGARNTLQLAKNANESSPNDSVQTDSMIADAISAEIIVNSVADKPAIDQNVLVDLPILSEQTEKQTNSPLQEERDKKSIQAYKQITKRKLEQNHENRKNIEANEKNAKSENPTSAQEIVKSQGKDTSVMSISNLLC